MFPRLRSWGGFLAKLQKQWLREVIAVKRLGGVRIQQRAYPLLEE